jgi:hypothetical protein
MIGFFKRRRRERQDAIRLLMQMPGKDAWLEARRRARAFDILSDQQRAHWSRVSHRLDRMLDIDYMTDTATRWLESPTS